MLIAGIYENYPNPNLVCQSYCFVAVNEPVIFVGDGISLHWTDGIFFDCKVVERIDVSTYKVFYPDDDSYETVDFPDLVEDADYFMVEHEGDEDNRCSNESSSDSESDESDTITKSKKKMPKRRPHRHHMLA